MFCLAWVFWVFFGLRLETLKSSALLQFTGTPLVVSRISQLNRRTLKGGLSFLLPCSSFLSTPSACRAHGGVRQLTSPCILNGSFSNSPLCYLCEEGVWREPGSSALHPLRHSVTQQFLPLNQNTKLAHGHGPQISTYTSTQNMGYFFLNYIGSGTRTTGQG